MSTLVDVKVPDIGDFSDVPVIELFVKPGDTIKVDDAICTLESDKATMDVPSSAAGVVKEVLIQLGSKVSEGTVIIRIEAAGAAASPAPAAAAAAPAAAPVAAPAAAAHSGSADVEYDMVVLGAGPGGYSAAFRAADLGLKTAIIERYATLGGVCLNVGCIPSKALLHVAAVIEEAEHASVAGVSFAKPAVDVDALRAHKDKVVGKLTGGLSGMAKGRKVDIIRGYGHFLDPNHIEVEETTGTSQDKTGAKKVVKFKQCIIAAGSAAVHLPFIPRDPRIVDSTGALALKQVPKKMIVLGGGYANTELRELAEPRVFDYLPLGALPHSFAETAHDCDFLQDTLVLVGAANGQHDGENLPMRDRLTIIESDLAAVEDDATWTVAGLDQGVQTRALALDLDDEGHYVLAGYSCFDACDPVGEVRVYAPGGTLAAPTISLGPLGRTCSPCHVVTAAPV